MSEQTQAGAQNVALMEMTAEVVAAYVAKNAVPAADLGGMIAGVYNAFTNIGVPQQQAETKPEPLKPAVPVKRSITDEYIISLEDGRKLKSMKRYLAGLGMTPADYRAKWGLANDYPMVAPAYAAKRSELAKSLGLGRKGQGTSDGAPDAISTVAEAPEGAKRGRKKAAA